MKFGLSDKKINLIKSVFQDKPEVDRVFIYGSRAKGGYKKTSDIDLAVKFKKGRKKNINKIRYELEELPVIHRIDVTDEDKIDEGEFKKEYEKTKKTFYTGTDKK